MSTWYVCSCNLVGTAIVGVGPVMVIFANSGHGYWASNDRVDKKGVVHVYFVFLIE